MDRVDEVLVSLREERERLQAELARVETAIASLEGNAPKAHAYSQMSLYEAVAHVLVMSDEPKTSREIADALRAGGFKSRARSLTHVVTTMLTRPTVRGLGVERITGNRWRMRRLRTPR